MAAAADDRMTSPTPPASDPVEPAAAAGARGADAVGQVAADGRGAASGARPGLSGAPAAVDALRRRLPRRVPLAVAAACVVALVALGLLGSLLDVGDRLMRVHVVLGVLFYVLVVALVAVGIVWPVARVASRPVFSLARLRDEQGRSRMRWCRRLAANMCANVTLTDEQRARLDAALASEDTCADELSSLYREACVPPMDARIRKAALGACAATAISQAALYDALSMLAVNVTLVRELVETCGFRPSTPQLVRVYARVLGAGLLAGGIEELDLEEMLPAVLGQAGAHMPGVLLASTTQGVVNAFTTYRIGVLTKRYLLDENAPLPAREARRASYGEALALMKTTDFYGAAMRMVGEKVDRARDAAWTSVKSTVKAGVADSWVGRAASLFTRRRAGRDEAADGTPDGAGTSEPAGPAGLADGSCAGGVGTADAWGDDPRSGA